MTVKAWLISLFEGMWGNYKGKDVIPIAQIFEKGNIFFYIFEYVKFFKNIIHCIFNENKTGVRLIVTKAQLGLKYIKTSNIFTNMTLLKIIQNTWWTVRFVKSFNINDNNYEYGNIFIHCYNSALFTRVLLINIIIWWYRLVYTVTSKKWLFT